MFSCLWQERRCLIEVVVSLCMTGRGLLDMHPIGGGGEAGRGPESSRGWPTLKKHLRFHSPQTRRAPSSTPNPGSSLGVGRPGGTEERIFTCRLASVTGGLGGCSGREQ